MVNDKSFQALFGIALFGFLSRGQTDSVWMTALVGMSNVKGCMDG